MTQKNHKSRIPVGWWAVPLTGYGVLALAVATFPVIHSLIAGKEGQLYSVEQ